MLRHNAGAPTEDHPRQEGTDKGVAQTDPGGRQAEFPAKLPCITDEDDSGEIRGAIGKGGQPRADRTPAQDKAVDVGRIFAAIKTNTDHHGKKDD